MDLWCFGGSFKAKSFSMKRKENVWFSCVFPEEPLPWGRAQQKIQNFHSGKELEKKGPCYLRSEAWSGPVTTHAPVLCSPVFIHCPSRSSKLDATGRTLDLSVRRKTDPAHSHLVAFLPGWGGSYSKVGFANSMPMHLFGILANLLKNNVNIKECKIS